MNQLLIVLLTFAFFPRAQRGKDGQSPNQNLEEFSSFNFPNICTYNDIKHNFQLFREMFFSVPVGGLLS